MDMYFELAMCNGAEDEVKLFEKLFQQCCDYSQPQIARMKIFKFLEEMYYALDSIMAAYDFHPEAKKYPDRFTKVGAKAKTFEDGINYEVPAEKGLYFIGETHFNPITDEKYYWVKVGKASNLKNRMKSYNTHKSKERNYQKRQHHQRLDPELDHGRQYVGYRRRQSREIHLAEDARVRRKGSRVFGKAG